MGGGGVEKRMNCHNQPWLLRLFHFFSYQNEYIWVNGNVIWIEKLPQDFQEQKLGPYSQINYAFCNFKCHVLQVEQKYCPLEPSFSVTNMIDIHHQGFLGWNKIQIHYVVRPAGWLAECILENKK